MPSMKTLPVVLVAGMMALLTNAWAAKTVDFSELAGSYSGQGTILAFGTPYSLTAKVKFNVPKHGKTAKVKLSGLISASSGVPWNVTLQLKKKGKMTTNNIVGISTAEIYMAAGRYKVSKGSKLETNAQSTVKMATLAQKVSMTVKPKGKKKKAMKVRITVLVDGAEYIVYNLKLTGKL